MCDIIINVDDPEVVITDEYSTDYDLPIASSSTLGGIKIGNNLNIDSSTGVLDAVVPTVITLAELVAAQSAGTYNAMLVRFENVEYIKNYDTYDTDCKGLPIGPIANPGDAAIRAALKPATTSYYYFCHNTETGDVFYANTMSEHEANMKKAGLS